MRRTVKTAELAIGMYVAELDKPWEQSSFLFQGFEIETDEDLAKLKAECQFVVIEETEASKAAVAKAAAARPAAPAAAVTTITSRSGPEPTGLKKEMKEVDRLT
ncbi:MAG: DUF3391 domain-containing protein [Gammaproteobacteria bacterium]